jgi:hypothetical protein
MSFTDIWAAASKDDNASVPPPPPGMYDVELSKARAFLSKKDEAWVSLTFKVTSKRARDHEWDVLLGFRSQGQANVAKNQIAKLGVDVDSVGDLDGLDQALGRKVGGYFAVEVKQNGDYVNTYVIGATAGGDFPPAPAAAPVPEATDDDAIPF